MDKKTWLNPIFAHAFVFSRQFCPCFWFSQSNLELSNLSQLRPITKARINHILVLSDMALCGSSNWRQSLHWVPLVPHVQRVMGKNQSIWSFRFLFFFLKKKRLSWNILSFYWFKANFLVMEEIACGLVLKPPDCSWIILGEKKKI